MATSSLVSLHVNAQRYLNEIETDSDESASEEEHGSKVGKSRLPRRQHKSKRKWCKQSPEAEEEEMEEEEKEEPMDIEPHQKRRSRESPQKQCSSSTKAESDFKTKCLKREISGSQQTSRKSGGYVSDEDEVMMEKNALLRRVLKSRQFDDIRSSSGQHSASSLIELERANKIVLGKRSQISDMKARMLNCWHRINALEYSTPFKHRMVKKLYPDYYQLITDPIDLGNIYR